jgi:hypothetical protein
VGGAENKDCDAAAVGGANRSLGGVWADNHGIVAAVTVAVVRSSAIRLILRPSLLEASNDVLGSSPQSTLASVIGARLHIRNHDANEPGRRRRSSPAARPEPEVPTREASRPMCREPGHTSGWITSPPTTPRLSGV